MRKISLLFLFGLFTSLSSQTPAWQWASKICTYYSDNSALATDVSGNVFVAGRYYNNPVTIENYTLTPGMPGSEDLFMVKYDPDGKVIWAKRAVTAEQSISIMELVCDKAGNVYIAGGFSDSLLQTGTTTYTGSGKSFYHSFLAKFDTDGNIVWSKALDGSSNEVSDMDVDADGNVVVTGSYWDMPLQLESTILPLINYWNIFLIKYDDKGNLIWARREGNDQFSFPGELAFDNTGNFCLRYNSKGDYINKYNAGGNVIWTKKITEAENIQYRQLICDSKLNIYYTADDTLHKLNASGTEIYKKKLGQGNNSSPAARTLLKDIGVDHGDNIYLCGSFSHESMVIDTYTLTDPYLFYNYGPQYGSNLFIAKLDPSGKASWLKGAGGSFDHRANALAVDQNANIFIAGHTTSATLTFDNKTMNTTTPGNCFLARLGSVNSTGIDENTSTGNFEIYPNPATSVLNLGFTGMVKDNFTITITDALSRVVYQKICHAGDTSLVLQLDDLSKGIYFVEVDCGTTTKVKKLVVD